MMNLSEDQKRKIEENRRRAMERLKRAASGEQKNSSCDKPTAPFRSFNSDPIKRSNPQQNLASGHVSNQTNRVANFFNLVPNQEKSTLSATASGNGPHASKLSSTSSNNWKNASNRKDRRKKGKFAAEKAEQPKRVVIGLCARDKIEVTAPYHQGVIETFKSIPSRSYDPLTKKWRFSIKEHDLLAHRLESIEGITLEKLPRNVCEMFNALNRSEPKIPEADLTGVDEKLTSALLPFQREGVNFGIAHGGRLLLADDMGLGKTIQAICLALYYRTEWPLLVVSPSSVRYTWRDQLLRWTTSLTVADIRVIDSSKDFQNNARRSSILILSYDLLSKFARELNRMQFKVVIMDECHFLKSIKTARTKAAMPILHSATRVFLLSGTPALSRPSELYSQVTAILPSLFRSFHAYGVRYCEAKEQPWGWDYSGCSNMAELQLVLEQRVMIRRTKEVVLTQLPEKRREMIILDPNSVKKDSLEQYAKTMLRKNFMRGERRGALLEYFHATAKAKVPSVKQYLFDLLESSERKFLIFAHHQEVLDALEDSLMTKDVDHIRIDGRTPSAQRNVVVEKFQLYSDVRVALLSITAASTGINLNAASLVVFAELFWNPGILVQAEDRVYRIGQRNCVSVQYLVANSTADDYIWPLVQEKLEVLSKAGLNRESFRNADTTQLGPKENTILDYFRQDFLEDVKEEAKEDKGSTAPRVKKEVSVEKGRTAKRLEILTEERKEKKEEEEDDELIFVPESPEAFFDLSDWQAGDEEGKKVAKEEEEEEDTLTAAMADMAEEVEEEAKKEADAYRKEDFDWLGEDADWPSSSTGASELKSVKEEEDFRWMIEDDEDEGWCRSPDAKRPRAAT